MERMYSCQASAAFGLEGLVSKELKQSGMQNVRADNGCVRFSATGEDLFLCNLRMHYSDRLYIILTTGICKSFEDLFQLVGSVDWPEYFSGNESIDISCKCTRSTLMSTRDCQSVSKKSIIEKLKKSTGRKVFPETGPSLSIQISVRNDEVSVLLNVSGEALSRRGYRTWNGEAPLRETLASALVTLSGWKPGQPLHDPCCGTGTILTEAALLAEGRAPGINRHFAMENYHSFQQINFSRIRDAELAKAEPGRIHDISGSDINPEALELARRHIRQAGLEQQMIHLDQIPLQELNLDKKNGIFICNPPYGERLSDQKQCRILYHDLFLLKKRHPSWQLCAISSDPAFERSFGRRADRKRRLYNGRLECVYYMYY